MDDIFFLSVDLELTNFCRNRCAMCPRERVERPLGFMDEAVFKRALQIFLTKRSFVTLSGMGDPLLHPKCFAFLRRLKGNGINSGIVVQPASLITEEVRKQLAFASLHRIIVSFPTIRQELFELLCPDISFTHALEIVKDLIHRAKGRSRIIISGLKTRLNRDEGKEFKEFWQQEGVITWFNRCHGRGGNLKRTSFYLPSAKKDKGGCALFKFHSFISWQGELLSCCHDLRGTTSHGNIVQMDLAGLIRRKKKRMEQFPHFSLCLTCDEPLRNASLPSQDSLSSISRRRKVFKKIGYGKS